MDQMLRYKYLAIFLFWLLKILGVTNAVLNYTSQDCTLSFNFTCSCDLTDKKYQQLTCNNFTSFSQLNFTQNQLSIGFSRIEISPLVELDFDNELNLTGLQIKRDGTLELSNIKRFIFESSPLKTLQITDSNKFNTLIIKNSKFQLDKDCKTLYSRQNDDFLFVFIHNIELVNVTFPTAICPVVFVNVRLFNLKIDTSRVFEFDRHMPERNLNTQINYVYFKNAHFNNVDSIRVFNRFVFSDTKKLYLENVILNSIQNDTFANMTSLTDVDFKRVNVKVLFELNSIYWMHSFNSKMNITTDTSLDSLIIERKYLRLSFTDVDYTFPDKDFCLFENFPFERLIFVLINSKTKVKCTCTILWIMRYADMYGLNGDSNLEFENGNVECLQFNKTQRIEAIEMCNFDKKIDRCGGSLSTKTSGVSRVTSSSTIVVSTKTNTVTSSSTPVESIGSTKAIVVCPTKCKCILRSNNSYELVCYGFRGFNELSFAKTNLVFSSVALKPLIELDLDDRLELTGLHVTENASISLSNVKSFSSTGSWFKNIAFNSMTIMDSKLAFKLHDGKPAYLDCNKNNGFNKAGLFTNVRNALFVNVKLTEPLCSLIFANTKLDTLEIQVFSGNLNFVPLKSHQQPLNSVIRSFTLKNAKIEVLDDVSVINRDVFLNTKTIRIEDTSVKRVHNRTFEHFKGLKNVEFVNFKGIFESGNDKEWISSLNYDLKVNLTNSKMVEERIKNKEYVRLMLRQNDYIFPDEDFCDFIFYPFDQLVFMSIEPKPECTCTLLWLLKYQYSQNQSQFSCLINPPNVLLKYETCNFNQKILDCKNKNKTDITSSLSSSSSVQSSKYNNRTLTIILSAFVGLFALTTALLLFKTAFFRQHLFICRHREDSIFNPNFDGISMH